MNILLHTTILISSITATSKTHQHPIVLTGTSGKLDESAEGQHVFVNQADSEILNGGPIIDKFYKLHFNVAGKIETIQQMKYIGYASQYQRYVFTKTP